MAEWAGDELQGVGAQGERLECAESWRKWGGPGLTPGSWGLCSPSNRKALRSLVPLTGSGAGGAHSPCPPRRRPALGVLEASLIASLSAVSFSCANVSNL